MKIVIEAVNGWIKYDDGELEVTDERDVYHSWTLKGDHYEIGCKQVYSVIEKIRASIRIWIG